MLKRAKTEQAQSKDLRGQETEQYQKHNIEQKSQTEIITYYYIIPLNIQMS